ncbi:hypothetical protein DPM19_09060 [Actinomadura craniellae]|uniref:LamG-like jellyroll fold domain-containing protein n=2 Tax=Actinomadura craniellae TaxID=2231787 RepID=A0A365H9X4_9ACTN|nr:hypothetical protein DPM19_09060 [Actinomadura craniellae]
MVASLAQIPALARPAPALAEDRPATPFTDAQALAAARKSGKPVEVLSRRGETRTVRALPTGRFEVTQHLRPVRTVQNGRWVGVDTTLKLVNGKVVPTATSARMAFSAGGDAPMVRMARASRELSLTWPGKLPQPVLDGDTATYRSVLPDVDLRLRAEPDGFAHVLVIKTPQAARDPRLAELKLKLGASGLSVSADAAGGLRATAPASRGAVFEAPAPVMWDSSHPPAAGHDPADGPGEGARTAQVGVKLNRGELALRPDRDLLTAPTTRYPVYVDPTWTASSLDAGWAMVSSTFRNRSYYKFAGNPTEGVGRCRPALDDDCAVPQKKRLLYELPLTTVANAQIQSAEFIGYETHARECGVPAPVQLWHTRALEPDATWRSTANGWLKHLATRDVAYCSRVGVEFGGTDLLAVVQAAADRGDPSITFGLRAADENSVAGWKRFASDAYLRLVYNRLPDRPDPAGMSTFPGGPCVTDSDAAPWMTGIPILYAHLTDPDGDRVQGEFRAAWDDGTGFDVRWTSSLTGATSSGSRVSVTLPGTIPQKKPIAWSVRTWDGTAWGPWSHAEPQAGCHFVYDPTSPVPPTVTSTDYPDDGKEHDGVGRAGTFTIADPGGIAVRYEIEVNGRHARTVATTDGAPRQVLLAPVRSGTNQVYVRSFTRANQGSASTIHMFRARAGTPPKAHFGLDEPAGSATVTAATRPGEPAISATPQGGVTLGADGQEGTAMRLDGATGHAQTAGPLVDTTKSFAISAWVRPTATDPAKSYVAVSQAGTRQSGLSLRYDGESRKWVFAMAKADADGAGRFEATSKDPARLGRWTHLAGMYNEATGKLEIFVNGEPGEAATVDAAWNATGPLYLGRGMDEGTMAGQWPGDLDDVRVFDRFLGDGEVAGMLVRPTVRAARWKLNTDGTDDTGNGHTLTLAGGATIDPNSGFWWASAGGLLLNGTDAYAHTAAPVVDTTRSFTITTWASTMGGGPTGNATLLSQPGEHTDVFALRYVTQSPELPFGGWRFELAEADAADAPRKHASHFDYSPYYWIHLAVVYDALRGEMRLYVNGNLDQSRSVTRDVLTTAASTGGLQIGRSAFNGEYWPDAMDDVWAYQSALTEEQIRFLSGGLELETPDGP